MFSDENELSLLQQITRFFFLKPKSHRILADREKILIFPFIKKNIPANIDTIMKRRA